MSFKLRAGESMLCGLYVASPVSVVKRLNLSAFPWNLYSLVGHNPRHSLSLGFISGLCLSFIYLHSLQAFMISYSYFFMVWSFVAIVRIQRFRLTGGAFDCDFNSPTSNLYRQEIQLLLFLFHVLITFVFQTALVNNWLVLLYLREAEM